ncbi:hypothetical protein BDR26DRAFT_508963 [Obelidium mucronatum]|nr:hypothetical protein BDR26DRAFT_508963 [Obelidium mucronatum]
MFPSGNLDSRENLEFTFVNDSLVCWTAFYMVHVFFAYLTAIVGILCMISRLHPRLYSAHHWLGKLYVIAMLWATASSLIIHNKGLPTGVIYSFLWVLLGLTFGWIAISLHTRRVFKSKPYNGPDRWRLIVSKMFSLKAFHGCAMFVSWINVAGLFYPVIKNRNLFIIFCRSYFCDSHHE